MKVNFMTQSPVFKGVREDRNTTAQLKQNNDYSLTEPNQRRINKAIENLAKQRGEENIQFLLDVGENLTYQTNIQNGKKTKNEWKSKLRNAAKESLAHSNPVLREKYLPEIQRVFDDNKNLSIDEKAILMHKRSIMKRVDKDALKDNPNENIKNLERNLDYFITSTETPTKQKRYVMQKLDFLMSSGYKINPQLKDKKTQVLAEMVNDLAINTPESKIPNIKAVNQKTHGMCAAISIARKAVAYEDKPNYVDAILSELDDSDVVKVYDRQNLGSGERVPVKKAYIDFDYAQERGYRIIDASTLQWMNIAGMYGASNEGMHEFNAFDKNNFDAFHDSFFLQNISDDKTKAKQCHYQALTKAKETIGSVKSAKIKNKIAQQKQDADYDKNVELVSKYNNLLKIDVKTILTSADKKESQKVFSDLLKLYQPTSEKLNKNPENLRKYSFLPNEEQSQKIKKVKQYFMDNYDNVDEKALNDRSEYILNGVETLDSLSNSLNTSHPLSKQIANARKLYEAESSYRASILLGLLEDDNLTDNLIMHNIPDRETRISEGYSKAIEKIEKNNDKKLMEHFARAFQTDVNDKEGIINNLKEIKENIDYFKTGGFDSLYQEMGYGSRHALLLNELTASKEEIKNGDKNELKRAATCMKLKQDKNAVLKEYEKLENKLTKNPDDEKVYTEVFNKMGYKNQTNAFIDIFNNFARTIFDNSNPESEIYKEAFKSSYGLPQDASIQDVADAVNDIGGKFNAISENMTIAENLLEVPNEDGTPYFTTKGFNILLKEFENSGKLVPAKDMRLLQERFTKIDKIRSTDEFSSRQGKISNPELYKMSKPEKEAVKNIDKKLNEMYSDVTRNLNYEYKEIKEPLSKLASYVGTNEGKYWIQREGESGLYGDQQVKIFEQLTDRPYYEVEDINEAVEMIKNGTHSGTSSSSVFHDRMGGHAQYVVDIAEGGGENKDILYHDNTWGASEHENTWIDSEGLLRTDYSDRRGGELGYITDKNWRNGNYVDNLTNKKGHITGEDVESKTYKKINPGSNSSFDFALMSGIILPGENPQHKDIAGSLKDSLFIPESAFIEDLEKQAGTMTKEQIKKAIFRNESAALGYKTKYEKIMKKIQSTQFNKGIESLEDYNKLSDNDIVKVAFEKAAIREAYPDASMYKELGTASTMKDVENIRNEQKNIAKSNFNYAFGKDTDILLYEAYEHGSDISNVVITALKDNNIPYEDKAGKIVRNVAVFEGDEKKQFTGSVKDSINFVVNKTLTQFDKNIEESEDSKKARDEIEQSLTALLKNNLYFGKEDLKSNTDKAKGIRKWIDEKFNPATDDEFVEIYKNLQDMKKEDFDKLTTDLTNEHLGISNQTGYDMLVKVRAANSNAVSTLRNTLFYDEYVKDLDVSKTKPSYKYNKTERKTRGAVYIGKRTFDDLYRTMNFSLSTLEYEKLFNKYKDENFRQYGAIPAYPKLDLDDNPMLKQRINDTIEVVNQTVVTNNSLKNGIYDIKLVKKLDEYRNTIPDGRKLTPAERKTINAMMGDFITRNYGDKDIERSINAALELTELDKNAEIKDYNKHIDVIVKEFNALEKVNSPEEMREEIIRNNKALKNYFNTMLNIDVPPKYHRILREDIKNWMNEEIKIGQTSNGIDSNKELVLIKNKIENFGIEGNDKDKINGFTKIQDTVNKVKVLKSAKKQNPEKIQEAVDKVNTMTDKYVNKYIKPEYQENVKADINDWMSKELVGGKRQGYNAEACAKARNKFADDYAKYHVTQHPQEILTNFLLLSASDAEPVRQKKTYKGYLQTELDYAKLIEVQDLLMEAVQTGNAAHVKNYFDDYYVYPYDDDTPQSMNSDAAIDDMVKNLILQDNTKTAKMFIEKLGLGDRVMQIESELLKEAEPKKKIDSIAKIFKNTNSLITIANNEVSKLSKVIDSSDNIEQDIDNTKKNIMEQLKNDETKQAAKHILDSLDKTKQFIQEHPDIQKSAVLSQEYADGVTNVQADANDKIKQYQEYLNSVNLIYNCLKGVHLPEYSKGYKIQQDMIKEQNELLKYNNEVLSAATAGNPDIEVTTEK